MRLALVTHYYPAHRGGRFNEDYGLSCFGMHLRIKDFEINQSSIC